MVNKKVSIVIPYYNRRDKLVRALASIYTQTYKNIEIIVIDDYSNIQPDFDVYDFIYIRNETNLGPGLSRNKGKEVAKGDYIVFLDSDDFFESTYIEKCVNIALSYNDDFSFVYSKVGIVDEKGSIISYRSDKTNQSGSIFPEIFKVGRTWATSSCFWNAEVVKQISWSEHRCWEDYLFDINASVVNNKIYCIDEILVFYDSTGDDKLSFVVDGSQLVEKSKSISSILEVVFKNNLLNDKKDKFLVEQLFVKNIYELRRYTNLSRNEVFNSISVLRKYNFIRFLCLCLTISFPKNISVKLLDKYRRF